MLNKWSNSQSNISHLFCTPPPTPTAQLPFFRVQTSWPQDRRPLRMVLIKWMQF